MDHARSQPAQAAPLAQANLLVGRAVDWALVVVLALLPFELKVGINLPGLLITNSELLISAALGLWLLLLASERRLPVVPRRLWLPIAIVVATLLISALLAQQFRGAALKFSLRQVQGALLAICVAERLLLGGPLLARRLVLALLAGGGVSALLGLVEMSEIPAVLAALDIFKEKPTLMGGLLRLSATFAYANIAAMYFEALLPLALIWAAGWGLGTGDWGQGTGDRGQGNGSQSPIPNPQSKIQNPKSKIQHPTSAPCCPPPSSSPRCSPSAAPRLSPPWLWWWGCPLLPGFFFGKKDRSPRRLCAAWGCSLAASCCSSACSS